MRNSRHQGVWETPAPRQAGRARPSAEPDRGLPDEGQQQEEQGDDRQDVNQGTEGLVRLGQLGERGVGGEAGQQGESHGGSG